MSHLHHHNHHQYQQYAIATINYQHPVSKQHRIKITPYTTLAFNQTKRN